MSRVIFGASFLDKDKIQRFHRTQPPDLARIPFTPEVRKTSILTKIIYGLAWILAIVLMLAAQIGR